VRFCGSINYHTELPILYNATKIHLNLTRVQVKTTINQRLLDGSAAGCFVLSDYRRDLGVLFDLEREVRFFRNKDEMRELILYYLTHQSERKEYVMRARERVLKEHTFERRLEKMIKIASKVLSI
jgi:spore maturation protein CgeB